MGLLLGCKSNKIISDHSEVKKILIFHFPFEIKLRRGIRYNEIEKRCSHIIKINPKRNNYFSHYSELRNVIDSLKHIDNINTDSLVVRTKMVFSFKNIKQKKVIYLLEDKTVVIDDIRYNRSRSILSLLDIN
jgi:hypothetical protein